MKICLKTALVILVIFFAFPFLVHPQEKNSIKLHGVVLDKDRRGIEFARILVFTSSPGAGIDENGCDSNDAIPERRKVTYSNKYGIWHVEIPQCETFFVKIYANAHETIGKKFVFKDWVQEKEILNFVMKESLSHILWGSLEHMQLYVYPHHQKNLERLVLLDNLEAVDGYLGSKIKPDVKKYASAFVGYILFENCKFDESRSHFEKAGSPMWFNLMGNLSKRKNQKKEALLHYLKGGITEGRAEDLLFLAKEFEHEGNLVDAKLSFQLALADYKILSRSYKYNWGSKFLDDMNFCVDRLQRKFKVFNKKEAKDKKLKNLLYKAGGYCNKLSEKKIYYFCHEIKQDKVFLNSGLAKAIENPVKFFRKYSPIKLRGIRITDMYKYDLQFVRESNGTISENRRLLIENFDKSNPGIPVFSYSVTKPLYGPHTLIAFGWQHFFDYKIISEEKLFDEDAVVLEVTPRQYNQFNRMFGKIWVNKRSGSVLKIEWCHREVQNREQLRAIGFILDRDPQLIFVSEFGIKKDGLRFPSRCLMVESYQDAVQNDFVRLEIDIDYKNYTFFMVSSEVELENK